MTMPAARTVPGRALGSRAPNPGGRNRAGRRGAGRTGRRAAPRRGSGPAGSPPPAARRTAAGRRAAGTARAGPTAVGCRGYGGWRVPGRGGPGWVTPVRRPRAGRCAVRVTHGCIRPRTQPARGQYCCIPGMPGVRRLAPEPRTRAAGEQQHDHHDRREQGERRRPAGQMRDQAGHDRHAPTRRPAGSGRRWSGAAPGRRGCVAIRHQTTTMTETDGERSANTSSARDVLEARAGLDLVDERRPARRAGATRQCRRAAGSRPAKIMVMTPAAGDRPRALVGVGRGAPYAGWP